MPVAGLFSFAQGHAPLPFSPFAQFQDAATLGLEAETAVASRSYTALETALWATTMTAMMRMGPHEEALQSNILQQSCLHQASPLTADCSYRQLHTHLAQGCQLRSTTATQPYPVIPQSSPITAPSLLGMSELLPVLLCVFSL